jgi:hypothetical protein
MKQGDVVGVYELGRREISKLSEADREDRCPKRVLEGLAGT